MSFADNFLDGMKGLATKDQARMKAAAKRDEELIKKIREAKKSLDKSPSLYYNKSTKGRSVVNET